MAKPREQVSKGASRVGALAIGTGTRAGTMLRGIVVGTIAIDPPSIAAVTVAAVTFTLTGARAGDRILMEPPALNTALGFMGARVTSNDTVTVYIGNLSAGAIDDTSKSWNYTWIRIVS